MKNPQCLFCKVILRDKNNMRGVVLRRQQLKEYDELIGIYTEERGKVEVIARGVKKSLSKNAAHLEPFSVIEFGAVPGKELDILTSVQGVEYFLPIRQSALKSFFALFVVTLFDKLVLPLGSEEKMFSLLVLWLEALNQSPRPEIFFIDAFVLALLSELGFQPELSQCVFCGKEIASTDTLYLSIEKGGAVGEECSKQDPRVYKFSESLKPFLEAWIKGEWSILGKEDIAVLGQAVQLHKFCYNYALFHLETSLVDWEIVLKKLGIRS